MDDVHGDEAAILQAAQERAAALIARDAAALGRLLHPALRWTTFRGEVLDKESYIAGNTGGDLRWFDQRLEDVDILIAGDTAVVVAVVVDKVERGGVPASFRLRLTQTWVKTESGWLCLAGHAGPEEPNI